MQVLKKPLLTEKVAKMQDDGVFAFIVDRKANKYQIREAVEKTYNVKVASVNTMIMPGKRKSRYTKSGVLAGQSNAFKKAIIKLEEGEYIDLYDNI